MVSKAEEYLKQPYARIIIPHEDGSFSAEILEFTGCFAQGDSPKEALKNLHSAAKEWIEACLRRSRDIPPPTATQGYSGTVSLRLPKALHRQASRMAERDGVSLNQYLVSAIAARVGADDLFNRMAIHAATYVLNLKVDIQNMTVQLNSRTFSPNTLPPNMVTAISTPAVIRQELEPVHA